MPYGGDHKILYLVYVGQSEASTLDVELEVIQQELEEEGSTGLTDNKESDDNDDDDVEDSQASLKYFIFWLYLYKNYIDMSLLLR